MKRAALLIGVAKTGQLPVLQAVGKGIQDMIAWAESQRPYGMGTVLVVSDSNDEQGKPLDPATTNRKVTAGQITDAIEQLVNDGTEQLFVYYAGHGANVRYSEIWLLSGAPARASEAVNLEGSIKLARQCGVAHVVVISDACRTPAATIPAQAVEGQLIFPNTGPKKRPGSVDVFYATVVGSPALEISKQGEQNFVAIYTQAITDGLGGKADLERADDGSAPVTRVKAWPLRTYLEAAVPDLLTAAGAPWDVDQAPDAIITSPPTSWLSQLPATETASRELRGGTRAAGGGRPQSSLRSAASTTLRDALAPPKRRMRGATRGGGGGTLESLRGEGPDVPTGMRCGFVAIGIDIREVVSGLGTVTAGSDGQFETSNNSATNAVVEFETGSGTLLPAIPDFIARISFDKGELANVEYVLSADAATADERIRRTLQQSARLRNAIADSARLGVLQPEAAADRDQVLNYLSEVGWLDVATVIYVSYALAAFGDDDDLRLVAAHSEKAIGFRLFDIAMLMRGVSGEPPGPMPDVYPAVPMLSRGWALLDANRVELPSGLRSLAKHVAPSLWTTFDPAGVALVRAAITSKEIR